MLRSFIIFILVLIFSCNMKNGKFSKLEIELDSMVKADQAIIAKLKSSTEGEKDSLLQLQQRILRSNTTRAKEILRESGFPGYNKVSKNSSSNFWLIVQHSDHDLNFQKEVLSILENEVEMGNASIFDYAYLKDRVRVNEGLPQIYGTQVYYDSLDNPHPKPLENPEDVNTLRMSIGLEPLEQYLMLLKINRTSGDTIKGDFFITH